MSGPLVRRFFASLRTNDLEASKRPTLYIANSGEVHKRIEKYYHRDSFVLWPPVEIGRFMVGSTPVSQRQSYVLTSALTPFKHVDMAVRVFTKLGLPLKIIGGGAQREALEKMAGKNIEFLGRISDDEIVEVYKTARGFIMPQKEDAGIAPIEAMASGIPVYGL